jgi:peptidoglycan biosynthesis protein MviN/MurJ (putative lipid II flippase)
MALFAEHMVRLIAPSWPQAVMSSDAVRAFQVASLLIPLHFAHYFLAGIGAVQNRFFMGQTRSIALNIGMTFTAIAVPGAVIAVLVGVVVAAAMHAITFYVQLSPVVPGMMAGTADERTGQVSWTNGFIALFVVALCQQLIVVAERAFASSLEMGSVTVLSMAFRIATIPVALGVGSFVVAYLVSLKDASKESQVAMSWHLRELIDVTAWFILPICLVMSALSTPALELMFMRGRFSFGDVQSLAEVLNSYLIGVPFLAVGMIISRALIVTNRGSRLMGISVISLVFYFAAATLMKEDLSRAVLGILYSAAMVIQCVLLFFFLYIESDDESKRVWRAWRKSHCYIAATVVSAIFLYLVDDLVLRVLFMVFLLSPVCCYGVWSELKDSKSRVARDAGG